MTTDSFPVAADDTAAPERPFAPERAAGHGHSLAGALAGAASPATPGRGDLWERSGARLTALGAWLLTRAGTITVLVVVTGLSLFFRTRGLHVRFWVDEGLSVGIAGHRLTSIPSLLRQDGSPPLYYLLLHVWISAFGRGEATTHLLSLVFATVAIPTAFWAGGTLMDRRAALTCATIAALLPFLTAYAQETRMYSLLMLESLVVATSFVAVFIQRRRRLLPVFVLGLTLALYTHNWSLFLAAMCAVAFLVVVRDAAPEDRRGLWRDGLIAGAGVLVLFAPWLPTVLYQARHTGAPWANPPILWSVTQGLYQIVGGRGCAVALLLGAGTGILWLVRNPGRPPSSKTVVTVLVVLGFGTLAVAFAYAKTTPAWALRYAMVIVGPLLVLAGLGLARGGRMALVAFAIVLMYWIVDPVPTKPYYKSNIAQAVAGVQRQIGTDPLVIATQPEQTPTLRYYVRPPARFGSPLGLSRDPEMLDWRGALDRFRHATVAGTLVPMLRTVPVSSRVVLAVPQNLPKTPQWMKLIRRANSLWLTHLEHDHAFRLVASQAPHQFSSGLADRLYVFARVRA